MGVVAYRFRTRDELLMQTAGKVYTSAAAAMAPVAWGAGPQDMLSAYIQTNLEWIAANPEMISALIALRAAGPAAVTDYCAGLEAKVRDDLERIFAVFNPPVAGPGDYARALRGAISTIAAGRRRDPGLSAESYAQSLTAIFTPTQPV